MLMKCDILQACSLMLLLAENSGTASVASALQRYFPERAVDILGVTLEPLSTLTSRLSFPGFRCTLVS